MTGDFDMDSNNIINPGTVDGRDISTDGAKLDTIESNATTDQTGAEIKVAYEAEADNMSTDDIVKSVFDRVDVP